MSQQQVLIVDDEPDIRELLGLTLTGMGLTFAEAADLAQARQQLADNQFRLCLVDMRLPDGDGIDLIRQISADHPDTRCAMITAHGNMETAIEALKAGAFDFVSKPVELGVLRDLVKSAMRSATQSPGDHPTQPAEGHQGESITRLLGSAPAIVDIRKKIAKLARSQAPVHISGESGTGKELAARLIHEQGPRASQSFVAVNCGAIAADLIESELFGHMKGSFTGAARDKPGLFHSAHRGTLLLDEVADLPLGLQVKLLRAIQERRVRRVGATREEPVDVRIISATHKDLGKLVEQGDFRQDLYYRIHVIELHMPALRDRRGDILEIADALLPGLARRHGISPPPRMDGAARDRLCRYGFPGNVRELENVLERALALAEDNTIRLRDLGLPGEASAAAETRSRMGAQLDDSLADQERNLIAAALTRHRWNRTAAARELGITLRALRYRIDKLGLDDQ